MSANTLTQFCYGHCEYYQDMDDPKQWYVFFDLDGMTDVPHLGELFRVGPLVGTCSGIDWDMREVVMLVEIEEGA